MRRLLIVLAVVLSSCGGQVDLGRLVQHVPVAIAPQGGVDAEAATTAVKRAIERANEAQQRAFATGDAALMRETATASYYDELTRINTELARGGVVGFSLVRLEWGDIRVSG